MITQYLQIYAGRSGIQGRTEVVQSDSGRKLKCQVMDMTIPDDCTARIYARKPSGAEIYNDCEVDGNTVLVELTTQFLAETGSLTAQVELAKEEEKVTSFEFLIVVKRSLVSGSAIESSNEFTALENALKNVKETAYEAVSKYLEENGIEIEAPEEQIEEAVEKYLEENSISGGGDVFMRVSDGYLQYSSDDENWNNILAISELKGAKGDDGGYYTPNLDDDGNLTWTASEESMPEAKGGNIKGPKGDKPEKGTDYFTEEDKADLVKQVLEAMPEDESVKYTEQTLTEEQQTQARTNIGAASDAEKITVSYDVENKIVRFLRAGGTLLELPSEKVGEYYKLLTDTGLTEAGVPADAAAVGERFGELSQEIVDLKNSLVDGNEVEY